MSLQKTYYKKPNEQAQSDVNRLNKADNNHFLFQNKFKPRTNPLNWINFTAFSLLETTRMLDHEEGNGLNDLIT